MLDGFQVHRPPNIQGHGDHEKLDFSPTLLARTIAREITQSPDGDTFDWRTGSLVTGLSSEIYIVSLRGWEQPLTHIPPPEFEIRAWLRTCELEFTSHRNRYVGWWKKEGAVILDVSKLVTGREEALRFGKQQKQRKIYHPATRQCLDVDSESHAVVVLAEH